MRRCSEAESTGKCKLVGGDGFLGKSHQAMEKTDGSDNLDLKGEAKDLLVMPVERTREYAEGLAAEHRSIFWHTLDFSRSRYGQPKP